MSHTYVHAHTHTHTHTHTCTRTHTGFINYIVAPAFEVIGQVFDFVADMSNKDGTVKSHDHERVKCATKSHDNEWVWHKCIGKNKETWTEKKGELACPIDIVTCPIDVVTCPIDVVTCPIDVVTCPVYIVICPVLYM